MYEMIINNFLYSHIYNSVKDFSFQHPLLKCQVLCNISLKKCYDQLKKGQSLIMELSVDLNLFFRDNVVHFIKVQAFRADVIIR